MDSRLRAVSAILVCAAALSRPLPASGQDFYRGKTIRLVVATTPGGGFDAYSRAIARHMGRHIPGNPALVVENMPGAAFLIGTNYLYNQARPDGLTVGNWIGTLVLHQVIGRKGIEFDARRFEYVGAPVRNHDLCLMSKASGIGSVEQWAASPSPVKMGATPPGSTPYDNLAVLKEALGLPTQIVSGYKGTAEIRLALDAGEVSGLCGLSWASTKVTWRKQLESGEVKVVLQNAPAPHPDLPEVPLAIRLAKTDLGRRLIQLVMHDVSAITYLYSLPPGTPKDRVQLLRRAFRQTMADPAFLAEAKKANLEVDPVAGEDVEKIVNGFFKTDPATVAKLRDLLK
ncbi:MAG TPA: tripartite tricarboxylate transporter substrate-binding protein [candidate division Zixibacteria bacterium]|nr:tripartite tricarboxylate transporter substrate-binding protein [candidate division Zixibacteria bacterium]